MNHRIALSFEDGVTRFITCATDQTVADASYRARINIPLDCRDGACGTCKAFCESGDYDGGAYIDDALSSDEAANGYVLPCSMKPKSDLVLQIRSSSAVAKTQPTRYAATITALDRLSPTTIALTAEIEDRDKLAFLPGQYVNIAVPGTDQSRSYSFSNGPADKSLTFLIKLTPGGVMSRYLTERAAVSDELTFLGPNGSFFLRETERPVLLLAGGTGLAPVLSILRAMRASGTSRPAHLIYGVSTDDDVVELDALAELAAGLDGFTWDYCVSAPGSAAPNKGYVTSLIRDEHLYDGDVAVYLCGPPAMVESVRKEFASRGIEPTGFYYEKFALSGTASPVSRGDAKPDRGTDDAAAAEREPTVTPMSDAEASPPQVDSMISTLHDENVSATATFGGRAIAGQEIFAAMSIAALETTRTPDAAPDADTVRDNGGRAVAGQEIFAPTSIAALETTRTPDAAAAPAPDVGTVSDNGGRTTTSRKLSLATSLTALNSAAPLQDSTEIRSIASRADRPGEGTAPELDPVDPMRPSWAARDIAGQPMFPTLESLVPLLVPAESTGGYEIGEEHPSIHESDAVFEAREALELGALELTIGRLDIGQLAGYRLLAESTLPYVDGDRFVDAAAYTEANAAFHDYLFTLTGNEHLLQAYRALGVQGRMEETLRHATWCHPRCARDHVDIVAAFEAGDRQTARQLIVEHAERSKTTMRRAMTDKAAEQRPAFISPGRFDGKVVVVTGAAQGIGERTARRISAEGGAVVLVDRSELVHQLAGELPRSSAVTADLETWTGAERMITRALDRHGRIDVLINNVGGAIWFQPFTEFTAAQIQAEITRSLMTTLLACRAALPSMTERGRGVIVNVSSAATRGIHRIPYSAAKGGINALTASLAMEYANAGIRVVATAPGGTDAPPRRISRGGSARHSAQEQAWFQAHIDQTIDSSPMKRYGTLDEQAAAITFLASDEASYITGTVLPVAGGDLG
ncbi:benzoate 1,2-dioxygenase electron transfer component BenC [Nocardia miyunensis]|uniref:benzoate 1,2-dioxygenase electron transfer component BenC n=1 Tax=Nocardia miyunensis TaxID=282684 RepID=UPI000831247C|nr:benzoate 1,2-dioxygenase electron transfer component BenC [Nocardia miyunensis]